MAKELLKLRKEAKKKKPVFVVKESKFCSGVKRRWRFPRGKHSKVRQMHKGRPALTGPGYGSPKAVKGLHNSGLEMVRVCNVNELNALNDKQGAIIAKVGKKKKIELLELASAQRIKVLNVKDLALEIRELKKEFEERKEFKKKKLAESGKKEEEKKKKAEEKAKKDKEEKEKKEGKVEKGKVEGSEEKKPTEPTPNHPPLDEVKSDKSDNKEKEEKKAEKKEAKEKKEKKEEAKEKKEAEEDTGNEVSWGSKEPVKTEAEKQKEIIEKTITKRQ